MISNTFYDMTARMEIDAFVEAYRANPEAVGDFLIAGSQEHADTLNLINRYSAALIRMGLLEAVWQQFNAHTVMPRTFILQ